ALSGLTMIDTQNTQIIGLGAFGECRNFKKAVMKAVQLIDEVAFFKCSNLENVELESFVAINMGAFSHCSQLNDIYLPDTLLSIGDEAFGYNGNIHVSINVSMKELVEHFTQSTLNPSLFAEITEENYRSSIFDRSAVINYRGETSCQEIKRYGHDRDDDIDHKMILSKWLGEEARPVLPPNKPIIGRSSYEIFDKKSVFEDNYDIEEVDLSHAKRIRYHAFNNAYHLKSVTFGEKLELIEDFSFSRCHNLEKVTIPNNKDLRIDAGAFFESGLKEVDFKDRQDFSKIDDNTLLIAGHRCPFCRGQTTVTKYGHYCPSCDHEFKWNDLAYFKKIHNQGTVVVDYLGSTIDCRIPYGITGIAHDVFNDTSIGCLTLPDTINFIGVGAFFWNDYMTFIEISGDTHEFKNLKRIEANTFVDNCLFGLGSLLNNVNYIGDTSFYGSHMLEQLYLNDELMMIEHSAFSHCERLKEIKFNDGILILGRSTFEKTAIQQLSLPDSVIIIQKGCFQNNSNLSCVDLGEGLLVIGDEAFKSCQRLAVVKVPSSVQTIGREAFKECPQLKEIILPKHFKYTDLSNVFDEHIKVTFLED
ncbi:MAG: leucine-rich repeat protein, partial [Erysipelotrichaceae bacterium]|nr:leucine-rich repeat protein [Erysipelotrichaceae bacterium]